MVVALGAAETIIDAMMNNANTNNNTFLFTY
jgi:hypothetical protein